MSTIYIVPALRVLTPGNGPGHAITASGLAQTRCPTLPPGGQGNRIA